MCTIRLKKCFFAPLAALFLVTLVPSCGELDVLTGKGAYSVTGLVNGLSLDDCAIVKSSNYIEPYFDCNIANDNDTQALRVIIKDQFNKIIGSPLRYELTETAKLKKNQSNNKDSSDSDEETLESTEIDSENPADTDDTANPDGNKQEINANSETKTDTANNKSDNAADNNQKEADSGDSADSQSKSGEADDTEGDSKAETAEKQPAIEDTIVLVDRFDKNLPAFSLPKNSPIGFYYISFMVIGKSGEVLQVSEKPIYYLADEIMVIEDIKSYLPGVSDTPHVVPPDTFIMLEAKIKSSSAVLPHIVWYSGKTRIGEGVVENGIYRFLWKSPIDAGFQNIKAEVFPFDPAKQGIGLRGLTREMSLPVSFKHGRHSYFAEYDESLYAWYEFWANTADSKAAQDSAKSLVPLSKQNPNWLPCAGTYGLAVGNNDRWTLPFEPFKQLSRSYGDESVLLQIRYAPLKDGSLLETELFDVNTGSKYTINLDIVAGNVLALSLEKQGIFYRSDVPIIIDNDGFAIARLDFRFTGEEILIGLSGASTVKIDQVNDWRVLEIRGVADGKGNIYLGQNTGLDAERLADTAVIGEIAVSYPEVSPIIASKISEQLKKEGDNNNEYAESDSNDNENNGDTEDTSTDNAAYAL